jgi:threonine synthase
MFAVNLTCFGCGAVYSLNDPLVVCRKCGDILDVKYDLTKIQRSAKKESVKNRVQSLWRYREFLPIMDDRCIVSLGEGLTPLRQAPRYATFARLPNLYLKLDYLNPTGAFKDRGSTVCVSKLKELNVTSVLEDSSGNAGASLAAYCAAAGIECTIYSPAAAPREKLVQARMYGAKVTAVDGSRTDVAKAAEDAWRVTGLHYASHNTNPFFIEGLKTVVFEIAEDMSWKVPEHVVFPVGGGTLLVGAYRGFEELVKLGWIERSPRLHCIQSAACMPIVEAFRKHAKIVTPCAEGNTVAGGIRITNPARGRQVLDSLNKTGGHAVEVSDEEIMRSQSLLAKLGGIFAEPTSCAALAGVQRLRQMNIIKEDEHIIVELTGFGLKDTKTAAGAVASQ